MDDLLKDLIAGDDNEEDEARGLGALSGVLGSLLAGAGGAPAEAQPAQGAGPGAADLMSLLGGQSAATPQAPAQGGGLGDLLGMLTGASAQQPAPAAQSSGLLGSLLGGGAGQAQAASPPTSGIASALAQKLGVSEAIASTIITFAVSMLLQSLQKRMVQRQAPGEGIAISRETAEAPDLGDVLKTLGSRGEMAAAPVPAQASARLAAQAGIDPATAERGLAEALRLLAGE